MSIDPTAQRPDRARSLRRGAIGLGALLALTAAGAGIARSESSQPAPTASTARPSTESTAPGSTDAPRVELARYSVTGKGAGKAASITTARRQQQRIQLLTEREAADDRALLKWTVAVNQAKAEKLIRDTVAANEAAAAERALEEAREAEAEAEADAETESQAAPAPSYESGSGGLGGGWASLRQCESGGNYGAVSSSGQYRGAYQFSQSTWNSVASRVDPGLVGVDPASASPGAQDAMAQALYASSGSSPWPVCGSNL